MPKLMPLLICLMLAFTSWVGAAQANDVICCPGVSQMAAGDCCDGDQAPCENGKACLHCQQGCHGQIVGMPASVGIAIRASVPESDFRAAMTVALLDRDIDEALRPPQA